MKVSERPPHNQRENIKERPQARQDFSYPKGFLFLRLVLMLMVLAFLVMLTLMFAIFGVWTAILLGVLLTYMLIVGISPFFTNHWVTLARLVLRQGLYFKTSIAYSNIESIEPTNEVAKYGVRASWLKNKVFVATSQHGLVLVKLRNPIRLMLVLGRSADELVISVDEPDSFVQAVRERMGLLPPVEPYRTYAKLRY
jgi:hypothetical protein